MLIRSIVLGCFFFTYKLSELFIMVICTAYCNASTSMLSSLFIHQQSKEGSLKIKGTKKMSFRWHDTIDWLKNKCRAYGNQLFNKRLICDYYSES